jgi:hypothetical protein
MHKLITDISREVSVYRDVALFNWHISVCIIGHLCVSCVQRGWTALASAAREGHAETVQALLRAGATVDQATRVSGLCPHVCGRALFSTTAYALSLR